MGESLASDALAQARGLFEALPDGVRRPIEIVVFGGDLPRADVSRMRWMAAELRRRAAAMDGHGQDAASVLAQQDSVGVFGDRMREALHLHRDGAVRLGDEARLLADQAAAAANDAEKSLCVMLAFGVELAWRIIRILAKAAAAGPAGQVAAAATVQSTLVQGRAKVALMRSGLKVALERGAVKAAARRSELGPLRLPVTLGKAAALPAGVDVGVQLWQAAAGERNWSAVGPNGENPTGIDPISILAAGISGAGGAAGGMLAGRFAPRIFPGLENRRLLLGLVHGGAGAMSGLGAAALVTGWPEHFDQVLASLLNGGFAGAVHAKSGARPGPDVAVDGARGFTRPDPPAARSESNAEQLPRGADTAVQAPPSGPVEVSEEAKRSWAAARTAWRAAPEAVTAGGGHGETSRAGANGRAVAVESGESRSHTKPLGETAGRAADSSGRSERASVEAGAETSPPPKVSVSDAQGPADNGHGTLVAPSDHRLSDGDDDSRTAGQSDSIVPASPETPDGTRPHPGSGVGAEGPVADELRSTDSGPAIPSSRDHAVELIADFHAASADQVPQQLRLRNLPDEALQAGLFDLDTHKSMLATMEVIRRGTVSDSVPGGMVLRTEQAEAVYALAKRPVEMKPGEGKSLVFMAVAIQRAVRHDACLLVTTTDGLANREFTRYRKLLSGFGIDVFRADQQQGFGSVVEGRPAIVVATGETVGHLCNAGHRPPRHVLIDEIDGIIDRGEKTFLASEGVHLDAPEQTALEVFAAHDFLAGALANGELSYRDFGLQRITEELDVRRPDGTWEIGQQYWYLGQVDLTPGGREKVGALPGGERWLEAMGASRLEMAAAAEFSCRKTTHYVENAGKIIIVNQDEHSLQHNPATSSESRWSAEKGKASLAQAVEAKEIRAAEAEGRTAEEHRIKVRADADSHRSITAAEIYRTEATDGREPFFDEVTGASGTLQDLNPVLEQVYGLQDAYEVGRSQEHRLVEGVPHVVENTRAKLNAVADYAHGIWDGGDGRFQMVLCHRNDLVEHQVQALLRKGIPEEAIEAVDADRIAEWGVDWEAELQKVFDAAGEQGRILVINRQGQRGVDISVSDAVLAKGGMHVWMTEVPEQSYIYEQAKNRTARDGDRGTAQALMSPQDSLIRNAMHLHHVREAVVYYGRAAEAHRRDPTPENLHALAESSDKLVSLVPELQERALHHANAEFLRRNAIHPLDLVDPVDALEFAEERRDPDIAETEPSTEEVIRVADLLGIPGSVMAAALLDQDDDDRPLDALLRQAALPPAAVEALRQHVEATAPAAAVRYALLTDEQALDQLIPRRDDLAELLGIAPAKIEGAEGVRVLTGEVNQAREALAGMVGRSESDTTPAVARDIVGEAVTRRLTGDRVGQPDSEDGVARAEDRVAERPAGVGDDVAVAAHYLAVDALLNLVIEVHRRSPNRCVENAMTGVRVLCPRRASRIEMPAAARRGPSSALSGHNIHVLENIFEAPLQPAGSLDAAAESLQPGDISVLAYRWKDSEARGDTHSDHHVVLLVDISTPGETPKRVVVDLAASRDGRAGADYGPQDLVNPRALLDKAVSFEKWRSKQHKFIDRLPEADRRFWSIRLNRHGIAYGKGATPELVRAVNSSASSDNDVAPALAPTPTVSPPTSRRTESVNVGSRPHDPDPAPADDGPPGAVGRGSDHVEPALATGRDRLDELDYTLIARAMPPDDQQVSDPALGMICREQGFDGLPAVAAAEDLDELIAAGGREFFRGVTVPWHVDNFRHGDYFPGRSMITEMGNGTYVTTKRDAALLFYADNRQDQVIRMVLYPGARTTDEDHLRAVQRAELDSVAGELGRLVTQRQTREVIAREEALVARRAVLSDLGRLAAALGYDAYATHGSLPRYNDQYWVILNRTAVMVEGDPAPARPTSARPAQAPDLPPERMAQIIAGEESQSPPEVAEPGDIAGEPDDDDGSGELVRQAGRFRPDELRWHIQRLGARTGLEEFAEIARLMFLDGVNRSEELARRTGLSPASVRRQRWAATVLLTAGLAGPAVLYGDATLDGALRARAAVVAELHDLTRQRGEQPPPWGGEAAAVESWERDRAGSAATISELIGAQRELMRSVPVSEAINQLEKRLNRLGEREWDRLSTTAGQQGLDRLAVWVHDRLRLEDDLQRATAFTASETPIAELKRSIAERRKRLLRELDEILGRAAPFEESAGAGLERLAGTTDPATAAGRLITALADHRHRSDQIGLATSRADYDRYIDRLLGEFDPGQQGGSTGSFISRLREDLGVDDPVDSGHPAASGDALDAGLRGALVARVTSLDDVSLVRVMGTQRLEAVGRLAAFRRGEPPPIEEMVDTARVLNVIVRETARRLIDDLVELADAPPGSESDELRREFHTCQATLHKLHDAATAVCEIAGALPREVGGEVRGPTGSSEDSLYVLDSVPAYLQMMVNLFGEPPAGERATSLWRMEKGPLVENAAAGLARFFEADRYAGRMGWSEYVDEYVDARANYEFEPALLKAFRSLPAEKAAFDEYESGSAQGFAAAAASYLSDLTLVARYYLTRSRNFNAGRHVVWQAQFDLSTVASRTGYDGPAWAAVEVFNQLDTALRAEFRIGSSERPSMRRHGFEILERGGVAREAIEETIRHLEVTERFVQARAKLTAEAHRRLRINPDNARVVGEWFKKAVYDSYLHGRTTAGSQDRARYETTRAWWTVTIAFLQYSTIQRALDLVQSHVERGEPVATLVAALREGSGESLVNNLPAARTAVREPVHQFSDAIFAILKQCAEIVWQECQEGGKYEEFFAEYCRARDIDAETMDKWCSEFFPAMKKRRPGGGEEEFEKREEFIAEITDIGRATTETGMQSPALSLTEVIGAFHFASTVSDDEKPELFEPSIPALRMETFRGRADLTNLFSDYVRELMSPDPDPAVLQRAARKALGLAPDQDLTSPLESRDPRVPLRCPAAHIESKMGLDAADALLRLGWLVARGTIWSEQSSPPVDAPAPEAGPGDFDGLLAEHGVVVGDAAVAPALGSRPPGEQEIVEYSVPEWLYWELAEAGWNAVSTDDQDRPRTFSEDRAVSDWPRHRTRFPVLQRGSVRVSVGWHGVVSHEDLLRRSWRPSQDGVRYAGLPDIYAWSQERDLPEDKLSTEWIKSYLLDPERSPLPESVIAHTRDEVTAMLRSRLPESRIGDPEVRRGIRLAAEGIFISRTLYGDPDVGRANHLYHDVFEKREHWIAAFYHNGTDVIDDLRAILDNGLMQDDDIGEIMLTIVADAWSDVVYGAGRRSDNPDGYDELKSAELLYRIASHPVYGYDSGAARILGFAVNATGFDEATGTQMIASTASVEELRGRWGLSDNEFEVAMRVGRRVAAADLQTLSEPDALVRTIELALEDLMSRRSSPERELGVVLSRPGIRVNDIGKALRLTGLYGRMQPGGYSRDDDTSLRRAFIDRLRKSVDFIHPDGGYRAPDGWRLGNPDMRRDHAEKLRKIVDRLESDPGYPLLDTLWETADRLVDNPGYTPLAAYRDAQSHADAMREKYNGGAGLSDPTEGGAFPDITPVLDRLREGPPTYYQLVDRARELAAEHPDVCELKPVLGEDGRPILSRGGVPMEQFVVYPDDGSSDVVVGSPHLYYGLVHSNEFWSSGTIEGLMDYAVNEPGARTRRRVFLLGLDPDGAMLAEGHASLYPLPFGWHKRTWYRQPAEEQPEYMFLKMPEGLALAALIREHWPTMCFSMHNMDIGQPFTGTTRAVPGLPEVVAAASRLVTTYLGDGLTDTLSEGEVEQLGPGLFRYKEHIFWHKIAAYARQHGIDKAAVVVVEAPMWRAGGYPDISPSEAADIAERRLASIDEVVAKLPAAPAFAVYRPVRMFIDDTRRAVESWRDRPDKGIDTLWARLFPIRTAALLWRYVNELLDGDPADTGLLSVERELDRLLTSWVPEFEDTYQVTPGSYRDSVGYQMRVCLGAGANEHSDADIAQTLTPELAGHLVARREDLLRRARDADAWLAQQAAVTTEVRDWVEAAIRRAAQEMDIGGPEDPPWLRRGKFAGTARELRTRVAALGSAAPADLVARLARFDKALADIDHRRRLIARAAELDRQQGEIGGLIQELERVSDEHELGELDTKASAFLADLERHRETIDGRPEDAVAEVDSAEGERLRRWAESLDGLEPGTELDRYCSLATEQLTAFRRGEPPPMGEVIATGRALNALVWDQCRCYRDDIRDMPTPRPAPPDLASFVDDVVAQRPELEQLSVAASLVVDLIGTLPTERWVRPSAPTPGYIEFLRSFPDHLGRTTEAWSRIRIDSDIDTLWDETLPTAIRLVDDFTPFFDSRRLPDGTNWSQQVDKYLAAHLRSDFSPALVAALRALTPDARSAAREHSEPDDVFATESLLRQLNTAVGYYLTRTRDVDTALALVRRIDAALEPATDRLGPSHPAVLAARAVRALHTDLSDARANNPDHAIPEIMRARGLSVLGSDSAERSVIATAARRLGWRHPIGAMRELGEETSAELYDAATTWLRRSEVELTRLAAERGVEPSLAVPGSPELAEQVTEFDSAARELVGLLTIDAPEQQSLAELILSLASGPERVAQVVGRIERGLRLVDSAAWRELTGNAGLARLERLPEWIARGLLLDAESAADLSEDPARRAELDRRRSAHEAELVALLELSEPIPQAEGAHPDGTDPLPELRLLGASVPRATSTGRVLDTVIRYLETGQLAAVAGRLLEDGMEAARLRGEQIRRELLEIESDRNPQWRRMADLEVEHAQCRERYQRLLLQVVAASFDIDVAHCPPGESMRRIARLRTNSPYPTGELADLFAAYDEHVAALADLEALSDAASTRALKGSARQAVPTTDSVAVMLDLIDAAADARWRRDRWAELCGAAPAERSSAIPGLRREFAELATILTSELRRTDVLPPDTPLRRGWVQRAEAAWESEQRRTSKGPWVWVRHAELQRWRDRAQRYLGLSHLFDYVDECERLDREFIARSGKFEAARDASAFRWESRRGTGWIPVGEARALAAEDHPGAQDRGGRIAAAADRRRRSHRAAVRGAELIGVEHPDRMPVKQLRAAVGRLVRWSDDFRYSQNPHGSEADRQHAVHIVDVAATTLAYTRLCRYALDDERAERAAAARDIGRELIEREVVDGRGGRSLGPGVAVVERENAPPEIFVAGPVTVLADPLAAVDPEVRDEFTGRAVLFRYRKIMIDESGQVYVQEVRPADRHAAPEQLDRGDPEITTATTASITAGSTTTTSQPSRPGAVDVDGPDQAILDVARAAIDSQLEKSFDAALPGERLSDQVAFLPGMDRGRLLIVAPLGRHRRALLDATVTDPRYAGALWRARFDKQYLEISLGIDGPKVEETEISAARAEGPYREPKVAEIEGILLDEYLRFRQLGLIETGFGDWLAGLGDHAFDSPKRKRSGRSEAVRGRLKQDSTLSTFGLAVAEAKSAVDPDLPHPTAVLVRAFTRQFALPDPDADDHRSGTGLVLRATIDLGGIDATVELRDDGDGWRVAPPPGRGHAGDVLSRWSRGMTDFDPSRLLRRIGRVVDAGGTGAVTATPAGLRSSVVPRDLWQLSVAVHGRDVVVDIRRDGDEWRVDPGALADSAGLPADLRDSSLTRLAWQVRQQLRAADSDDAEEVSRVVEIPLSRDDVERYEELERAAAETAKRLRTWSETNAAVVDRLAADHPEMPDLGDDSGYSERLAAVLWQSVIFDREALADELGIDPIDLESLPLEGGPAARRADILRRESDLREFAELAEQHASLAADMSRAARARDGFLAGRVVAAELEGGVAGRQPTESVGYLPDAEGGLLIVAAPAGGHMRSLSELAVTDSKFAGALWRDDMRKRYLRVTRNGDQVEAKIIGAFEAEGPNRAHSHTDILMHLLDHYLAYRAAGAIDLGFRSWLEQLGPQAFRSSEVGAGTRETLVDPAYLLWLGSRLVRSGVEVGQYHPARVLHRLQTRRIPPLERVRRSREPGSRVENPKVTLGAMDVQLALELHEGRWRLAAGSGSRVNDVLAQHFPDLTAESALGLVAEIGAAVNEDAAADTHHVLTTGAPKTCFVAAAEWAAEGPGPRPQIAVPDDHMADIERLGGVDGRDAAKWAGANWRAFKSPEAIVAHVRRTRGTVIGAVEYGSFDPEDSGTVGAHAFTVKMVGDVVVAEEQVARLDDGKVVMGKRTVRGDIAVAAWVAHLFETAGAGATFHGLAFKANGEPENPLRPGEEPAGLPGLEFPRSPMGERPPGRAPPEADAAMFPDITRVLDRLPGRPRRYHELVDRARELAAAHPDVCELRPVLDEDGSPMLSRGGVPMEQFVVHADDDNREAAPHLYYGLVHSNEFWSSGTIEGLMDYSVSEPGARTRKRVLLLGLDPDGGMRAEGFAGYSPLPYEWANRTLARQLGEDQPERNFGSPTDMPETRALEAIIREHRPEMLFSLHNLDIGAPWVAATREIPGLAEAVAAASRLSGLSDGDPIYDMPGAREVVRGLLEIPEGYVWHRIADYAERQGISRPTVIVIEAPMWREGEFSELSLAEAADIAERRFAILEDVAAKLPVTPASYKYRAARMFIGLARWHVEHWRAEPEQPSHPVWTRVLSARAAGMLWQYANELLDTDPTDTVVGAAERELDRLLTSWVREFEDTYEITPASYRESVAYQMRVCLSAGNGAPLDAVLDAVAATDPRLPSEPAGNLVARRDEVLRRAMDAGAWLAQQIAVTSQIQDWVEAAIRRSTQELGVGRPGDPPWLQRGGLAGEARELRNRVMALGPDVPADLVIRSAGFAKALADIDHRRRLITRAADLDKQYKKIGQLIAELEKVSDDHRFGELDTMARDLIADIERRRTTTEEEAVPEPGDSSRPGIPADLAADPFGWSEVGGDRTARWTAETVQESPPRSDTGEKRLSTPWSGLSPVERELRSREHVEAVYLEMRERLFVRGDHAARVAWGRELMELADLGYGPEADSHLAHVLGMPPYRYHGAPASDRPAEPFDLPSSMPAAAAGINQPEPSRLMYLTPVARALRLTAEDTLYDIGSGLGTAGTFFGAFTPVGRVIGLEIEPAYAAYAAARARALALPHVHFVHQHALEADLSAGSAFYFYNPFHSTADRDTVGLLAERLTALGARKPIRIAVNSRALREHLERSAVFSAETVLTDPTIWVIFRSRPEPGPSEARAGAGRETRFIVTGPDNAGVALDRSPDLMSLARTHADEVLRESEELGLLPPAASSAVYNRRTGEVFFGVNNTHAVGDPPHVKIRLGAPKPLHPLFGARMPAESLEEWPAANCAEVHAANKALLDASLPESLSIHRHLGPPDMSDLVYSTVRTPTGQPYPSCRNCQLLLGGAMEVLEPGPQRGIFLGAAAADAARLRPDPPAPPPSAP
ncbi:YwqJ-related putative deaminase [Nocardia thraciensis]